MKKNKFLKCFVVTVLILLLSTWKVIANTIVVARRMRLRGMKRLKLRLPNRPRFRPLPKRIQEFQLVLENGREKFRRRGTEIVIQTSDIQPLKPFTTEESLRLNFIIESIIAT